MILASPVVLEDLLETALPDRIPCDFSQIYAAQIKNLAIYDNCKLKMR
jgi:hypothetical protein